MVPRKWILLLFFGGILLLGLPMRVKSEESSEIIKDSSAKDCKVHIEKALEQYWEHKDTTSNENGNKVQAQQSDQNLNDEDDDEDDDDDDDDIPIPKDKNENGTDEDDEDEEDEDENNNQENDDDDDDDEDDDEEDGDNQELDQNEKDEGDQNDEDEEDEDDEKDNEESQTKESVQDEDEDDEDDEEEVDQETKEDDEDDEDDEEEVDQETKEDDEDDEDEDDEKEDDEEEEDEDEEEKEIDIAHSESKEDKAGDKDSVPGESEEDEDEDDDVDEEQAVKNEEIEDEEEEEEEEEDEKEEMKTKIPAEAEKSEKSEEVTGEAHPASTRMAQEFSQAKPTIEQPKTSQKEKEEEKPGVTSSVEKATKETIPKTETDSDEEEEDDDSIENIYEEDEDEDESSSGVKFRSRDHIDVILDLDEIGSEYDKEEEKLAQSIFRDIKKIQFTNIKPMEVLYKYTDSTTRVLGDAEIFNKPMLLFLGPWNSGKTTIINYLLGVERTPLALKTGTGITDVDFTLITYGDERKVTSGTELALDWRYAGVQKFGQGFLDHFRSISLPHTLLKKVIIVDTPGILENKKNQERGYSLNDAFQWFIDRADAIYVVLDPNKVDIGGELASVIDQLKGREVRFILNKADTIRRSDLMRVVGQLFWNLSPLMSSTEAPVIYAVSLTTKPYHPSAPAKFLTDQEKNFLYDLKNTLDNRVENRILYARKHAVRVRNHAKMIDCYLATYYKHKSIFSNKKNIAKQIIENPRQYNIFDGFGNMANVSRYDILDPENYREFFKLHPLYDFKPLASTCSYFRGCPMDKLDTAITNDIPELYAKYKKSKIIQPSKPEER